MIVVFCVQRQSLGLPGLANTCPSSECTRGSLLYLYDTGLKVDVPIMPYTGLQFCGPEDVIVPHGAGS